MDPEVQKVMQALGEQNAAMIALITKQNDEISTRGASTDATAKEIKENGDKLIQIQGDLAEKMDKFLGRMAEKDAAEAEKIKERQRPGFHAGDEDEPSLGAAFVKQFAGDEGRRLRENLQAKNVRNSQAVKFKSFVDEVGKAMRRKAVLATDAATRFSPVMREPMLPATSRQLHLRNLMNVVQTSENSGEYVEELGFAPATGVSVTSISQSGGTATLTKAGHGFRVGQKIKVSGADQAGYNLIGARVLSVPSSSTLTYAVDSGTVSPATGTILMFNLSASGAAAGTAEGSAKPEAEFEFELKNWNIRTIAHWIAVSRQAINDVAGLQNFIDNRLIYGVLREEDRQLVYGPGTGQTLQGIYTHPNVQTLVGSGKKLDVIRRSVTLVQLAEMEADGVLLSPEDWEAIQIAKGDDGHYIWVLPNSPGQNSVWQLPVISSTVIEPGDFVTGAWGSGGATLYDREEAQVLLSYDHDDFFVKNLLALLGEERVGVAWHRPEAFVAGDFGTAV